MLWGPVAEWTEELSLTLMKNFITRYLGFEQEPGMTFFASGALNKLYAFDCAKDRYLIRDAACCAKCEDVERNSYSKSVPRKDEHTYTPCASAQSGLTKLLGFEWMVMERVDAQPLR